MLKFITILIVFGITINAIEASPILDPVIFDSVGKIISGIGDVINGLIKGGQNAFNGAVDVLSGIVKGGSDIGTSVVTGITNTITNTIVQSTKSLGEISQKIRDSIQKAIASSKNYLVSGAAEEYKEQIEKIQNKAKEIFSSAQTRLEEIENRSRDILKRNEIEISNWASTEEKKTESKSEDIKIKAKEILNEFQKTVQELANACASSIIATVKVVVDKTKLAIHNSLPEIESALLKIEECAQVQANDFSKIADCTKQIREKTIALSPLSESYSQLSIALAKISPEALSRSDCILQTRQAIEDKKKEASAKIDALVN